MQVLKAEPSAIPIVVGRWQAGDVVIIPTETVYGLAADARNVHAVEKIRELKGREETKPFQLLSHDVETVRSSSLSWNERVERLARAFWPGPLTVVIDGVGWRIPDHAFLRELLHAFGRPVAATSANKAGEPPARSCEEAVAPFQGKIHLALNGGHGSVGKPSSVVKIEGSKLEILREEAIAREELQSCWDR